MPQRREDAATAWTWVGLWVLFIYMTIPLARTVQEYIRDHGGKVLFLWVTYVAFGIGAAAILRAAFSRRIRLTPGRWAILAVILGVFSSLTWTLRANPEEALHFVQYGVLGLLLFRALRHHVGDPSIYFAAAACGTFFGILDELIQWIVPRRYFDFRDIGINILAVLLVQAALGWGIRPSLVSSRAGPRGLKIGYAAMGLDLVLVLVCLSMTPPVIDAIHGKDQDLKWLNEATAEYGYRYEDPAIGVFQSRLTPRELARADHERGPEVAEQLDRIPSDREYYRFIDHNPPYTDPFLVEARIHLFRRDRYLRHYNEADTDEERVINATVALSENMILERYFSNTLARSSYGWTPERKQELQGYAILDGTYRSRVSIQLITAAPPWVFYGAVFVMMGVAVTGYRRAVTWERTA